MYQKIFQITLVLFFVAVSIAVLGLIISALMFAFSPQLMAESGGISAAAGGLSEKLLGYIVVAASLIVAGFYLFLRRRRFRR